MRYIISIFWIVVPIIVSLIAQLLDKNRCEEKLSFVNTFLNKFNIYIKSYGTDFESYSYMIKNSNQMQSQLGRQGLMTVQQPFDRGIINNYTLILTGLGQIKTYLSQPVLRSQALQLAGYVNDALLRNAGDYEKKIHDIISSMKNPIILYKTGWGKILSVPFMIFLMFGIITERIFDAFVGNRIFKVITGIIALIGFVSGIMTIVLGYNQFLEIIINFF
jgi:hypothetical protein